MKYGILCLTTGQLIRLNNTDLFDICDKWVTLNANYNQIFNNWYNHNILQSTPLLFGSREAADWIVRRRLSYNPARTRENKLRIMNQVFELNNLNPLAHKIEYEIVECNEEGRIL